MAEDAEDTRAVALEMSINDGNFHTRPAQFDSNRTARRAIGLITSANVVRGLLGNAVLTSHKTIKSVQAHEPGRLKAHTVLGNH